MRPLHSSFFVLHSSFVSYRLLSSVVLLLLFPRCLTAQAPTKISAIRDFIQHLQWSPDGKKFLFTRIHAGHMGLWTMNTDGTDLKPLLAKNTQPHFDGHWSPDGKHIVFVH